MKRRTGRLKYLPFIACQLFLCAALTSCGELFTVDEEKELESGVVSLERSTLDIMVGDSYTLDVQQRPDTLTDKAVSWVSDNDEIVSFSGEEMTALAPGKTRVTVTWIAEHSSASCMVNVIPRWTENPRLYPYDMLVFANITVNGKPMDDQMMVAAFAETEDEEGNSIYELRGVGRQVVEQGISHVMLRVYSPSSKGEMLVLRCYDRHRMLVVESESAISFDESGKGTLSDLYPISFD